MFAALLAQGGEFGFVVFGAAATARVLSAEWNVSLTAAVAISMALALIARDRLAARRLREGRTADAIDDNRAPEHCQVKAVGVRRRPTRATDSP